MVRPSLGNTLIKRNPVKVALLAYLDFLGHKISNKK